MSTIYADYQDPNISAIRQMLAGKNDDIPILLMPVRLETRFMKAPVEQTVASMTSNLETTLFDLADTQILLSQDLTKSTAQQKVTLFKTVASRLTKSDNTIRKMSEVTAPQKAWLVEYSETLKNIYASQQKHNTTSSIRKKIDNALNRLNLRTANRNIKQDDVHQPSRQFIQKMKSLRQRISKILEGKTPFIRAQQKRQLYEFVDRLFGDIRQFYHPSEIKIEALHSIKPAQVRQIENIHQDIRNQLQSLPIKLRGMHGDSNWKNFVNNKEQTILEFKDSFLYFEQSILLDLNFRSTEEASHADAVFQKSLRLYLELETGQASRFTQISQAKSIRKQLRKKIKQVHKDRKKRLYASSKQWDNLTRLWTLMDVSLVKFKDRFDALQNKKRLAPANRQPTIRTKANSLFRVKKSKTSPSLKNIDQYQAEQELAFARNTQQRIEELETLSRNKKLNAVLLKEQLQSLEQDLSIAKEKSIQLPPAFRRQLNNRLEEVRDGVVKSTIKQRDKIKLTNQTRQMSYRVDSLEETSGSFSLENFSFADEQLSANTISQSQNELWVRIFPDDLFVHTHEAALTERELHRAKQYWTLVWAEMKSEKSYQDAWRALCTDFGTKRAAWMVKAVHPAKVSATNFNNFKTQKPTYQYSIVNTRLYEVDKRMFKVKNIDPTSHTDESLLVQYAKLTDVKYNRDRLTIVANQLIKSTPAKQPRFLLEESLKWMRQIQTYLQQMAQVSYRVQKKYDQGVYKGSQRNSMRTYLFRAKRIINEYQKANVQMAKVKVLSSTELVQQSNTPFVFPTVPTKKGSWTKAPHTRVLPDRFVVITRSGNAFRHIAVGNVIPDELQLGMDPQQFDFIEEQDNPYLVDEQGNLTVEQGLQWLVDYDEALSQGMAISLPLTDLEAEEGFDQVFVLGIKDKTATEAKALLETLLENHQYAADGMELLEIGTPTNNTEAAKSGYGSEDDRPEAIFELELKDPLFDASETSKFQKADGLRLAESLGLNPGIFQHIKNAEQTQISNAQAMHNALWHATLGDAMEEMWDSVFTYDNIERTQSFFQEHVIARGSLPSIRIGQLPYGILPTTAYSIFRSDNVFDKNNLPPIDRNILEGPNAESTLNKRFDIRFQEILLQLNSLWTEIRKEEVPHAFNAGLSDNPRDHFMKMLGLTASTADLHFRYGALGGYDGYGYDDERMTDDASSDYYDHTGLKDLFAHHLTEGYLFDSFYINNYPDDNEARQLIGKIRHHYCGYLDQKTAINGPIVDGQELDDKHFLRKVDGLNYIEYLLNNNLYEIFSDNDPQTFPSRSVLYLLLRQSFLLSNREAALKILQEEELFSEEVRRAAGGIHFYRTPGGGRYRSKWSYLLLNMTQDNFSSRELTGAGFPGGSFYQSLNGVSMASYLQRGNFSGNHASLASVVGNSKSALTQLAPLSNEALDHLLREHLDVCTYRLDAWMTGLSNKRLSEMRFSEESGIYLGAYAWVENLRPGGERNLATAVPTQLTDASPIYTDEDNQGFIHAPSINHAAAAAVLRSAYQANNEQEDINNVMAVNLSSQRIRKAMQLLDGVQNGMQLGAVLGYQLEKGLHERYQEAELDRFIQPLRKAFPLDLPINVNTENVTESLATNVVNGMDLLNQINTVISTLDFGSTMTLYEVMTTKEFDHCPQWLKDLVKDNGGNDQSLRAILKEIDHMADAFDALGDLAISESVYQVVQGNHVRASAMLQALGEGKAPPMPLILDTPRTGTLVTHKAILHLPLVDAKAGASGNWPTTLTPRALAEPSINAWLSQVLADPKLIQVLVEVKNEAFYSVALSDLGIQAIDLLYLIHTDADEEHSELSDLIKYKLNSIEKIAKEASLKVIFDEHEALKEFVTISEIQFKIAQVKTMLTDALPLAAHEMLLPSSTLKSDNPGLQDVDELENRIKVIEQDLRKQKTEIESFLTNPPNDPKKTADFVWMRNKLLNLFYYGMPNALSGIAFDEGVETAERLVKKLEAGLKFLSRKLSAVDQQLKALQQADNTAAAVNRWINIAKAIFGSSFLLLPQFQVANFDELNEQINGTADTRLKLHGTQAFPLEEWLQGIGEVREKMNALDQCKLVMEANGETFYPMEVCQFPFDKGDYWLGIAYPEDHQPANDKQSMIMINSAAFSQSKPSVGIVLDQWVEMIPNRQEVTGITFNYDQPDATPAHSMLLAVPPQKTGQWKWDHLVYTLIDTLDLAKNRAVEPDQLENSVLRHVLPGLNAEVIPFGLESINQNGFGNVAGTHLVPMDFYDNLEG